MAIPHLVQATMKMTTLMKLRVDRMRMKILALSNASQMNFQNRNVLGMQLARTEQIAKSIRAARWHRVRNPVGSS